MPKYCAAVGCTNNSSKQHCKEKRISFFAFPLKHPNLLKEWIVKVKREHFEPTGNSTLCSEHFTDEDFVYQNFTQKRFLKQGAIPSIFAYKPTSKRKRPSYQFGPTEDQRKRKPDDENIAVNGTVDSNSVQHCHSSNTSETSQNQNFSANDSDLINYPALLLPKVQMKEEKPFENNYNFPGNSSLNSDTVKILSVKSFASSQDAKTISPAELTVPSAESTSNSENQHIMHHEKESKRKTSGSCDTTFYKKPMKIDKREEAFGKVVACEMSDLRANPELYLKTQQSILNLLVEAHFDLMSSNNLV